MTFQLYQPVKKTQGDYTFEGVVISVMEKVIFHKDYGHLQSGIIRYAVQNRQGLIHIFSESQLEMA